MLKPSPPKVGQTVYPRYFGDKGMTINYIETTTKTSKFPSGNIYTFSCDVYGCVLGNEQLEFCLPHLSTRPLASDTGSGNHRQLRIPG